MFTKALILAFGVATQMAYAQQELEFLLDPRELSDEDLDRDFMDEYDRRVLQGEDPFFFEVDGPITDGTPSELRREQRLANKAANPEDRGYFRSEKYQAKNRKDKMKDLWGILVPDENDVQEPMELYWTNYPDQWTQKAQGSFCQNSDELRSNRLKTSHTQGVVARVAWKPVENTMNYSGIYGEGSDTVILRLSETTNLNEDSDGLMPSLALKFLVDGQKSQNVFAMSSFMSSGSWNFFENPMTNRVEPFSVKDYPIHVEAQVKKFVEASQRPFALSISCLADNNNDGTEVPKGEVTSPYSLYFTSEHQFDSEVEWDEETDEPVMFWDQLKRIKKGETILKVQAYADPEKLGNDMQHIADIVLLTDLHTSIEGDARLHFQHRQVSRDRKYWSKEAKMLNEDPFFARNAQTTFGNVVPEGFWPDNDEEAYEVYMHQQGTYGCPFAWLVGLTA